MTVRPRAEDVPEPICPGCRAGDHFKCDTSAWDEWDDKPTYCYCWARDHEERR